MELKNDILDHRYELLERIGGGGMADVYKAHDTVLDRIVAVKILHEQLAGDSEFLDKFQKEAKGAAKLSHANIVNIFDVGVDGDIHYIVMEYVAGQTLKKLISERGRLTVKEALHIAKEIAGALAHAHANNLVHCDIKPHNILVMPGGEVKVADFGIARAITSATMTYNGTVVGSVHYLSPEQAKGTKITPRSDVYSLGVVLYEMVTGELPFNGETTVSIALKHLQEEPVPPHLVREDIPAVVEAIILKMMSKQDAERPDGKSLVDELDQAEAMLGYASRTRVEEEDPFATRVMKPIDVTEIETDAEEDEEEEPEQPIYKSKKALIAGACLLILSFAIGMFAFLGDFRSSSEVVVPDVVGKQMNLARQILEAQNLRVNVAETFDAKVPPGQVVSQSPEAKKSVKENRVVTIYVSKGGEEIVMPDLNGLTRQLAEEKINRMGLKIGSIYTKFSNSGLGLVLEQEPRAGQKITQGSMVDLTVSKGQELKKINMPELRNMKLDAAKAKIASTKLKLGDVASQESNQPEGTVISQSIAAGSETMEGTSVNLVVAAAGKSSEKTGGEAKTPSKTNSGAGKSDR